MSYATAERTYQRVGGRVGNKLVKAYGLSERLLSVF